MKVPPPDKIHVVTYHENGTLNLWNLAIDAQRNSTAIVNIRNESRLCGHRFTITQMAAHPFFPLLLTSSQFPSRNSSEPFDTRTVHKQSFSEIILWKITSTGPLCKTGGLCELTRITSQSSNAFLSIAWIPSILPRFFDPFIFFKQKPID
jgi:hypothetical protein